MSGREDSPYATDWLRVARQDWHRTDLAPFRPVCERISGFYIAERYPSLGGDLLEPEDVQNELPGSRSLIRLLFPNEGIE